MGKIKYIQRFYTIKDIEAIVEKNNWSMTTCSNEVNGENHPGFDTIQIAPSKNDSEYFGEFIGEPAKDIYQFKLYFV